VAVENKYNKKLYKNYLKNITYERNIRM